LAGEAAPTPDEISSGEKRSKLLNEDYTKLPSVKGSTKATSVSNYWLTALQTNLDTGTHVLETDEPALKSLTNIIVTYPQNSKTPEFNIEFQFAKNQYFTNNVLKLGFVYQVSKLQDES
jgi:nucleosome assembly protein 1-like 1